jgi:hypothetical protein
MRAFGGRIPDGAFGAAALSPQPVLRDDTWNRRRFAGRGGDDKLCPRPGARKGDPAFQLGDGGYFRYLLKVSPSTSISGTRNVTRSATTFPDPIAMAQPVDP